MYGEPVSAVADDPTLSTGTLRRCFVDFIDGKTGCTRELYEGTLKRLEAYCPEFVAIDFER